MSERPTDCPGDDTLIQLVEKALPPDRVDALANHVDHCARCRATVGHLAGVDDAPAPPSLVGRYRVEDQLGAGAMGVVWAAWDPMLERRVAIKLMRPEVGEHGAARLLREARALAQLQHPNVVAVFDVGEHQGEVFVATELVDGEPLDRWQLGRTPAAIVDAYVQAARGLAAAHAMGLIHRDVKPSNLFVARDGRVRVGDFGLARPPRALPEQTGFAGGSPELTRDGAIVGTPAYMAPEQRAGRPVDGRADQFALCVALAEGLTGKRPEPDQQRFDGVDPRIATGLARGLSRDPDARFPDMSALVQALIAPEPATASRVPWAVAIAALLLAAGVGGYALAMRGSEPPAPPPPAPMPVATVTVDAAPVATVPVDAVPVDAVTVDAPADAAPRHIAPRPDAAVPADARTDASIDADNRSVMAPAIGEELNLYLDAVNLTNQHKKECFAAFEKWNDLHTFRLPQSISPAMHQVFLGRCMMLAARCRDGENLIRGSLANSGRSKASIDEEIARERQSNCPASAEGDVQDRASRLQIQAFSRLQAAGTLEELQQAFRDAQALLGDQNLTKDSRLLVQASLTAIAEGFVRLEGHCPDARQALHLAGTFVKEVLSKPLQACWDETSP